MLRTLAIGTLLALGTLAFAGAATATEECTVNASPVPSGYYVVCLFYEGEYAYFCCSDLDFSAEQNCPAYVVGQQQTLAPATSHAYGAGACQWEYRDENSFGPGRGTFAGALVYGSDASAGVLVHQDDHSAGGGDQATAVRVVGPYAFVGYFQRDHVGGGCTNAVQYGFPVIGGAYVPGMACPAQLPIFPTFPSYPPPL